MSPNLSSSMSQYNASWVLKQNIAIIYSIILFIFLSAGSNVLLLKEDEQIEPHSTLKTLYSTCCAKLRTIRQHMYPFILLRMLEKSPGATAKQNNHEHAYIKIQRKKFLIWFQFHFLSKLIKSRQKSILNSYPEQSTFFVYLFKKGVS